MLSILRAMTLALCALSIWGCSAAERDTVAMSAEQPDREDSTESTPVVSPDGKVAEDGKARPTNRLARETSPYLLLHAHNPVDWYPWGPEAFETAKREDKPIFLSIGYSSCYWCHVMERLVFENEKIAEYMNEHFVNVKVDREERPDVDDIYMTALHVYFQAIGSRQGGGWPLSLFLTPEGKPIAGGTYFPPEDEHGRMGFPSVMSRVVEIWTKQRKTVESTADLLVREVRRLSKPSIALKPVKLERALFTQTVDALLNSYDSKHGGIEFNAANPNGPKFPVPSKIACLQYEMRRHGNEAAADAVYHTLNRLAAGGIHDHLGGGFHRYSTDRSWHVPHFEKMLYDQAQLADVYVEAFLQTNDPDYATAAAGIFNFVLREMTGPRGGCHSALDAETDGVEGKRYVWEPDEIREALGSGAELFSRVYGLNEPRSFEHGYVLHLPQPIDKVAEDLNVAADELKQQLAAMRERLLAVRDKRKPLLKDDKVLTSWNGLMITALAHGGKVLRRTDLTEAAQNAAMLNLTSMRDENGRLRRSYRAEQATLNAYLDDYAFLVEGLLALYEATGDPKWLNASQRLTDDQIQLFWDEEGKGFFFTSHHHEKLLARTKNAHDSVLPSGNSVSVRNLIRLAALTRDEKYLDYARETLQVFAPELSQRPRAMSNMALALSEFLDAADDRTSGADSSGSSPEEPVVEGPIVQVGAEKTAGDQQNRERVTAKAYLSVDRLPAGGSCRIVLLLDVEPGWHINANPAQPDFLIPTTFTLKSKQGAQLENVTYPQPHELKMDGIDQPLLVYEGRVAIYGVVNVPAEAGRSTDEIELKVRYQACNDEYCIAPTHVTLRGRLPVAAAGQPVKRINGKLFPEPNSR